MEKRNILLAFALIFVMASPIHASADSLQIVTIPRHSMLTYDVATLNINYNQEFSGSVISVYRIQDEGEFLYYTYDTGWTDLTQLQFLLKEGDYRLTAEIPSADSVGKIIFELPFTIDDPDMDESQSFDRTKFDITLTCDGNLQEDTLNLPEQEIQDRIIQKNAVYTMARRNISIGDLEQDGEINATDSALILQCCAEAGAGGINSFTSLQVLEADVNKNGDCDAEDASIILQYSAEVATGIYNDSFELYLQNLLSEKVVTS